MFCISLFHVPLLRESKNQRDMELPLEQCGEGSFFKCSYTQNILFLSTTDIIWLHSVATVSGNDVLLGLHGRLNEFGKVWRVLKSTALFVSHAVCSFHEIIVPPKHQLDRAIHSHFVKSIKSVPVFRNLNSQILHSCKPSFLIENYEIRSTESSRHACTVCVLLVSRTPILISRLH